jgi:hypothetical protein
MALTDTKAEPVHSLRHRAVLAAATRGMHLTWGRYIGDRSADSAHACIANAEVLAWRADLIQSRTNGWPQAVLSAHLPE